MKAMYRFYKKYSGTGFLAGIPRASAGAASNTLKFL